MEKELVPGDVLPTEKILAAEFRTTRMNVFRALEQLKQHGIILRKKRAGSTVAQSLNPELIKQLFNESSKIVYVLLSRNPRRIHWNKTTFSALEQTLKTADYSVRYLKIPTEDERDEFKRILDLSTGDGAAALILFPDTGDEMFINSNIDLLLAAKTPVMFLHRSDAFNRPDFASSIVIDHFSDGINLGKRLRRNGVQKVILIRNGPCDSAWRHLRTNGLKTGTADTDGIPLPFEEIDLRESAAGTLAKLIRQDVRQELFFIALNDEFAAEFIDRLSPPGLQAGRDYHLAAFDDNPEYHSCNITTMQVPQKMIGEIFGRMICEKSWHNNYPVHVSVRLESQFIQRSSCRKLK